MRHQLLVSAYGCEPGKGSEQGVGWHWVQEMAKTEELWVLTRSNNRAGIESALSPELAGRIHFIYYDLPQWVRRFKRREKGLYLYYTLWQWGALRVARRVAAEVRFDYCLHLTFGSMWMPTFMYMLPIPFIWGPIGGGESVPSNYINTLPWRGRIPQYARRLLIRYVRLNPFWAGPAKKARAIIARTDDSRAVFPEKYRHKVLVMLETGMREDVLQQYKPSALEINGYFIELVYVGRLVAFKNVAAAIRALAVSRRSHQNVRLTIVGDGPLRASLTALADKLDVLSQIRFAGAVSHKDVLNLLQQSHIFIFPSLREGGAWSLVEAMAAALPVICLDTSGMHVITDDACAIRIPPTTPGETIRKMADAIVRLADSPELRTRMGTHGRNRIKDHFLWSRKGIFMNDLLNQLDGESVEARTQQERSAAS